MPGPCQRCGGPVQRRLHAPVVPGPEPSHPLCSGGGGGGEGVGLVVVCAGAPPEARRSLPVTGWTGAARWRRAARRRPQQTRLAALVHAREAPGSTRPRRRDGRARRQCSRRCRRRRCQASASRAAKTRRPRAAHPRQVGSPPAGEPTTPAEEPAASGEGAARARRRGRRPWAGGPACTRPDRARADRPTWNSGPSAHRWPPGWAGGQRPRKGGSSDRAADAHVRP